VKNGHGIVSRPYRLGQADKLFLPGGEDMHRAAPA
jgi:hypothetical protein